MLELVESMFSGVGLVIENMADALKSAFLNFIYVDPSATTPVISDIASFSFIMAGVGLGIGIIYLILRMVRR